MEKTEKKSLFQVVVKLTDKLFLGVTNLRLIYGHDDSLPFEADLYIQDKSAGADDEAKAVKVARVWNDGWGGDAQIETIGDKSRDLLSKANEQIAKHRSYYKGEFLCMYRLSYLCDIIANDFFFIDEEDRKHVLQYHFDDEPVVMERKTDPKSVGTFANWSILNKLTGVNSKNEP